MRYLVKFIQLEKKQIIFRLLIIIAIVAANIAVDQYSKAVAEKNLRGEPTVHVVGDFFILKYAENNGAFLSMFSSFPKKVRVISLILFPSIFLLLFIVYIITQKDMNNYILSAYSLIIGGGVSNLIDRIFNNEFVIDFMNVGIGPVRSGIFNVADLAIVAGVVMLLIYTIKHELNSKKNEEISEQ